MTLARRLERTILLGIVFANLVGVGALVLTAAGGMVEPGDGTTRLHVVIANLEFGAVYLALALVLGLNHLRRRFRPIASWLASGRPATDEERHVVLTQPLRQASWVAGYWVVAAVALASFNLLWYSPGRRIGEVFGAVLLFGIVPCAITYVFVEWAIRPALALALDGHTGDAPATSGVLARLVVAWLLGSGVFFLHIFLVPFGRSPTQLVGLSGFFRLLSVAGFTAGLTVIVLVSRDVSQRLVALRAGLDRVRHGDIDTEVIVDDASEVGLLQSGFNEMLAGLRERRTLQDLFGRHVGVDVARHALEDGVHLGGDLRDVSVVFVDVVGSTALAHERSPGEVVALLNRFFSTVVGAVDAEGGWVNKFEGDAALCVFGAPEDQPDHASRALRAAMALHSELVAHGMGPLDVGIGVSTGDAVAGNIGTESRFEFTVIGDPVNEACRLSEQAKQRPSRVLASGRAVAECGDARRDWVEVGTIALRGRSRETVAYEPRQ
jgi:adenylate cyclase